MSGSASASPCRAFSAWGDVGLMSPGVGGAETGFGQSQD